MSKKISFRNVTKIFAGAEQTVALKSIDFDIPAGGIAALYGPSGSGKSTVLNIASGIDLPTSGQVLIGEDVISEFTPSKLTLFRRQNIGFIFQSYNLFSSLTAVENVEMIELLNGKTSTEVRKKSIEALEKVGLSERINYFPSQLSGGQQQRVAVARAIASNPHILFADEPTANLDSQTALSLIDLLFELNHSHKTTILFSTHDSNILTRVPQLIKIKDGVI
ncbi:MAG: ABC transporter ATP-binding protein [Bdellovibrionales bacterium]|nr:ABC transporter ATP-binding protein [Bdellovibrionales bacterium]